MEEKELNELTKLNNLKDFVDIFSEIIKCKKLVSYSFIEYSDSGLSGVNYGRKLSVVFEDESGVKQSKSASYETYYGDSILVTLDSMHYTVSEFIDLKSIKTQEEKDSKNSDRMKNFKLDRGLM